MKNNLNYIIRRLIIYFCIVQIPFWAVGVHIQPTDGEVFCVSHTANFKNCNKLQSTLENLPHICETQHYETYISELDSPEPYNLFPTPVLQVAIFSLITLFILQPSSKSRRKTRNSVK